MKFPRILAASAIATAFAFADPMDDQDEAVEQTTEFEQSAEPTDEQPADASTGTVTEAAETEEQVAEKTEDSEQAPVSKKKANKRESYQDNQTTANNSDDAFAPQPQKKSLCDKPGFGVHGSFEYAYLHGLPEDWNMGDDADAPAGTGFIAGIRGRIPMNEFIQFTPELNYHYVKLDQNDEAGKRKFTQMDLEIPLTIRGIIANYFYLTAGVQVGFDLGSEVKLDAGKVDMGGGLGTIDVEFKEQIDKANVGLGIVFGVGGLIMEYISIDLRLVMGLIDVYDVDPEKNDLIDSMEGGKQMTFKAGLGFWFM